LAASADPSSSLVACLQGTDGRHCRSTVNQRSSDMAFLQAKSGPRRGERIQLKKVTLVGRHLEAEVQLDDLAISRKHARLIQDDRGGFIVEDLGSGNGTFVNGVRIQTQRLKHGDQIQVGNTVFTFNTEVKPPRRDLGDIDPGRTMLHLSDDDTTETVVNVLDVDSREARQQVDETTTVEQLVRANSHLQTLREISESLAANLEEQQLLDKILMKLFEVFPETHRGFIILREPETGQLTTRARKVIGAEDSSRVEISKTIIQFVLDKKQAVLSRDAMEDTRFRASESIVDFGMRSFMCAPLKHEEEILGFIMLETRRVSSNYDEEGLGLLAGLASQASLAIANARMHARLVARERLEQELANARRIQLSFLPQQPPEVPGYEFVDWYDTAQEVGGDFYDFLLPPSGKVGIVVGDVSGKGIPAALMMAQMTSHVRVNAANQISPARITAQLNEAVLQGETELFVTTLIMALDTEKRTITMANAGHLPPLVKKSDGHVEKVEGGNSFPVGIVNDAEFPEISFEIEPNELVCVFTDGIVEAMNAEKETFGYARLIKVLEDGPPDAAVAVRNIRQAVKEHASGVEQSDDLTLICFGPTEQEDAELVLSPT